MRLLITIGVLSSHVVVCAQSVQLHGSVVIQNSVYATGRTIPVSDASVRAEQARPVISDAQGGFALALAGIASGTSVRLNVEKDGLEVVNAKELESVVVGGLDPLKVRMADARILAEEQRAFHRIAVADVDRRFEEKMQSLRDTSIALSARLKAVGVELQDSVATLADAMNAVMQQRDAALEKVDGLARTFVRVDLDEASDRYRAAYELFRRGVVDSVLVALDLESLEKDYRSALDERARGADLVAQADRGILQVVQSIQLRAQVLQARIDLRGALQALERIRTILWEQPELMTAADRVELLANIADQKNALARREDAWQDLEEASKMADEALPADHLARAHLHWVRARVRWEFADYQGELTEAEACLAIRQRLLGMEHPEVAEALLEMARACRLLGDYPRGMELARRAASINLKSEGPQTLGTSKAYAQIALLHERQGELDSTLYYRRRCLSIDQRILPPGDGKIINDLQLLGDAFVDRSRFDSALIVLRESHRQALMTYGPLNPMTAYSRAMMANAWLGMAKLDSARAAYEEAISVYEGIYGREHATLAPLLANYGGLLLDRSRPTEALPVMQRALRIEVRTLGEEHPEVAAVYYHLGRTYYYLYKDDSAMVCYERCLAIRLKVLGREHYLVAYTNKSIGQLKMGQGKYEEANVHLREALAIMSKIHGESNVATLGAVQTIGENYLQQEIPDSAIAWLERARRSLLPLVGTKHNLYLVGLNHLALARMKRGDLEQAQALADSALALSRAAFPDGHPFVCKAMNTLGQVLLERKDHAGALAQFDRTVPMATKAFGPKSTDAAVSRYLRGTALFHLDRLDSATVEFERAEGVLSNGRSSWYLYKIALSRGDRDKALEHLIHSARIRLVKPGTPAKTREELRAALTTLAREMQREDVIEEFDLE